MSYSADAGKGIRQEFTSCYTKATASVGMAMCWTFPTPTGVGERAEITTEQENLGYWASPAWDRVLYSFAGIMWNHGRVAPADTEALMISRGFAPLALVDNRKHATAGNNWSVNVGQLVPNIPLGFPNSGGYGDPVTITFDGGVWWPQYRAHGTEWLLLNVHAYTLDTISTDVTGTTRAMIGGFF